VVFSKSKKILKKLPVAAVADESFGRENSFGGRTFGSINDVMSDQRGLYKSEGKKSVSKSLY
jgi:hypothetical protein